MFLKSILLHIHPALLQLLLPSVHYRHLLDCPLPHLFRHCMCEKAQDRNVPDCSACVKSENHSSNLPGTMCERGFRVCVGLYPHYKHVEIQCSNTMTPRPPPSYPLTFNFTTTFLGESADLIVSPPTASHLFDKNLEEDEKGPQLNLCLSISRHSQRKLSQFCFLSPLDIS